MNKTLPFMIIGFLVVVAVFGGVFFFLQKFNGETKTDKKAQTSSTPTEAVMNLKSSGFDPSTITVIPGSKVTFKNVDSSVHTIRSVEISAITSDVATDESMTINYQDAGTYHITDGKNTGTVVVSK